MLAIGTEYLDRLGRLLSRPLLELERNRIEIGRLQSRVASRNSQTLQESEFRVFSQFGEDGIIQHLIDRVEIDQPFFVEIGVESFRESNTRFLMENDNWPGVIFDAANAHRRFLRRRGLSWRHQIDAVATFVDRDNIDDLLRQAGVPEDLALFSLDIDGVDYWVFEAVTAVRPRILILEYNSLFGPDEMVSVPYDPVFRRGQAHSSFLYWGASLAALTQLANSKGYVLVGGNTAGNNAFWVREDLWDQPAVTVAEAWRPALFRESRDADGRLSYLADRMERLRSIADMPVVRTDTDQTESVAAIYGL